MNSMEESHTDPSSNESGQEAPKHNEIREAKSADIIGGAKQEDQLEGLKPDPETDKKQDSETEMSHPDQGNTDSD